MPIMTVSPKSLAAIWGVNVFIFALMVAASWFVDGNGRYPGMDGHASLVATVVLFVLGLAADGLAGTLDKRLRRRVIAGAIAILYLLMLGPAFI